MGPPQLVLVEGQRKTEENKAVTGLWGGWAAGRGALNQISVMKNISNMLLGGTSQLGS